MEQVITNSGEFNYPWFRGNLSLPSVLWYCRSGYRKASDPWKLTLVVAIWLAGCHHSPPPTSQSLAAVKSRIFDILVPAYLRCTGNWTKKRICLFFRKYIRYSQELNYQSARTADSEVDGGLQRLRRGVVGGIAFVLGIVVVRLQQERDLIGHDVSRNSTHRLQLRASCISAHTAHIPTALRQLQCPTRAASESGSQKEFLVRHHNKYR